MNHPDDFEDLKPKHPVGRDLNLWEKFLRIFGLGRNTSALSISDFEAQLLSMPEIILVPYTVTLTNPTILVFKAPSPEDFLAFMKKHHKNYVAVYVFKKPIGNGRWNYMTANFYFGVAVDV